MNQAAVKYRPILMSGPMVVAAMREVSPKTQTRRIVKGLSHYPERGRWPFVLRRNVDTTVSLDTLEEVAAFSPYGQPGNRLWVRETWGVIRPTHATPDGRPYDAFPVYRADRDTPMWDEGPFEFSGWKPSIHMPRWASRLTLEVVSVRAERLNAISEDDCCAEGCGGWEVQAPYDGGVIDWQTAREDFAETWNRINGEGAWLRNPWVWAVEFRRVTA